MPEFFALLGIDIFLAISLITCLLDKHFPGALSYIYQLAALTGFGHLLVSREFLGVFEEYTRFWYSAVYLAIALANIVAINVYLAFSKKQHTLAKLFLTAVTAPAYFVSILFIHNYAQVATYPIVVLPSLPMDSIFVAVVTLDTVVVGVGVYLFLRPKWWHITATGSAIVIAASLYTLLKPAWQNTTFLVFAVLLGVACFIVLGASIFILLRLWWESKKEKQ
ncbi:MAG: hypothetical protein QXM22_06860 [Candidatus Bathyarchaeia archaeon]